MKQKRYIIPVLVAVIFTSNLFLSAGLVLAQDPPPGPSGTPASTPPPGPSGTPNPTIITLRTPLKVNSIAEFLELVLKIVTLFALPIIIFFIIYAGFLFVTAQGKPDQITKARNALLYSVVGGVIILGAHLLLAVIQGTVGTLLAP